MSQIPANPFLLVDGSSYLFRAYHALPPLTNSQGQPTGAMYGVVNMLRKLLKEYEPEHIAVIFDPKGKTFRNDLYPDYKANRDVMPDELASQIKPLFEMIRAMGLPLVVVDGVEADDVIGTLAKQAEAQGKFTLISTGDKDMAQLVNDKVMLVNTMTETFMDIAGVKAKFGVPPELIIDYLALMGDKSDNIPGVPKVGPKTAVKWLEQYGSLQSIIEHADEFKGKVGENLRDSVGRLPLSKQLTTILLDVKIDKMPDELILLPPENERLLELFKQYEFKRWIAELETGVREETVTSEYETIFTEKQLIPWIKKIKAKQCFAFDTETTSLNYMEAQVVGVSFAVKSGEAAYVPMAHDYDDAPEQLGRERVFELLGPILADPKVKKIGQNIKYDKNVLANHGVELNGIAFDTMLESFVLGNGGRNDMDSLALKYLNHETVHFEDIAGKGAKQKTFNQIDIAEAAPYAAEDADITLQLHQHILPLLQKEKSLQAVFAEIEMPLVEVLSRVEQNGVLVDADMLNTQSQELAARISDIEAQVFASAEATFNLGSPKQLQEILFEKLKLPILQKTPKGQPSTAESVLQDLAHDYPIVKQILAFRSFSKLKSTYTDKLPLQVNERTGRVHTSYHQAGAATGRFSSTDPNLQNIPVRTEEGRRIRQAFIAPKGCKIIAADYSQIELRIMAKLSGDKGLQTAFTNGLDIHRATAAEVFATPIDDVTSNQRRSAKAINFGLIYGMSAFGLAKQLDIERDAAQSYIDMYFDRYPGVADYMDGIRSHARDKGYVETLFGRRFYLPEINARNVMRQKAAERTAINAPMQGTAADIIKRAMVRVDDWIDGQAIKMIMQVHDELVFEVPENDVAMTKEKIRELMCQDPKLDLDLIVDVGVGDNWDEAH